MAYTFETYSIWMEAAEMAAERKVSTLAMSQLMLKIAATYDIVVDAISVTLVKKRKTTWRVSIYHHDVGQSKLNGSLSAFELTKKL